MSTTSSSSPRPPPPLQDQGSPMQVDDKPAHEAETFDQPHLDGIFPPEIQQTIDQVVTDHDHELAQSIAADLFGGVVPEDLLQAINQVQREDDDHDELMEGGMQDAAESMINSIFSSDFLDQLNENSDSVSLDMLEHHTNATNSPFVLNLDHEHLASIANSIVNSPHGSVMQEHTPIPSPTQNGFDRPLQAQPAGFRPFHPSPIATTASPIVPSHPSTETTLRSTFNGESHNTVPVIPTARSSPQYTTTTPETDQAPAIPKASSEVSKPSPFPATVPPNAALTTVRAVPNVQLRSKLATNPQPSPSIGPDNSVKTAGSATPTLTHIPVAVPLPLKQSSASVNAASSSSRTDAIAGKPQDNDDRQIIKKRRINEGLGEKARVMEGLDVAALQDFEDILSIPGISEISGDLREVLESGSTGEKPLSQAQIDEIVASLGRPGTLDQKNQEETVPAQFAHPIASASTVSGKSSQEKIASAGEDIDELEDDNDPASQAQELLAMISALLPAGEDYQDDGAQSEDELENDIDENAESPAPASLPDGKVKKEKDTPAEKKEKKRRNRMVLSCTECHRRCDRNIPCARCVKRGVPELCHMEAPVMPTRKGKRKREDEAFYQAMSAPGFDWTARVRALESLLRTNPAAFADLDLNNTLVSGMSSLQMPLSEVPTADEQEMQNQIQAVISLINQAQAAQHQLELEGTSSNLVTAHLTPTGAPLARPVEPNNALKSPASTASVGPNQASIKVISPLTHATDAQPRTGGVGDVQSPRASPGPSSLPAASSPGVRPVSQTNRSSPMPSPLGVSSFSNNSTATPKPSSSVPSRIISANANTKAPTSPLVIAAGPDAIPQPLSSLQLTRSSSVDVVQEHAKLIEVPKSDLVPLTVTNVLPATGTDKQSTTVTEGPDGVASAVVPKENNGIISDVLETSVGGEGSHGHTNERAKVLQLASKPASPPQPLNEGADPQDVGMHVDLIPSGSSQPPEVVTAIENDTSSGDSSEMNTSHTAKDSGALNIPANLQAELAKLAQGVQDSAFTDDLHESFETDINLNDLINGDTSAILAQLASSITVPMAVQPSETDDAQGTILMDMITQLTNGGNKAQTASLLNILSVAPQAATTPTSELWASVPQAPVETTQQVARSFSTDIGVHKLNLGLAGFREDDGRIFVPPTTRQVERQMHLRGGLSHEALPIEGHAPFLDLALKFAYGKDGYAYKEGRIAAVQTMSVTGALKLGATFLSRFPAHPASKVIYIPNPTIEEEAWALREAGLEIRLYRFFDRRTGGVDWEGMREDLQNAPHQSIILMHVGGSTPTGAELTAAQWRLITEVIKQQRHIPFLISEFQGLSSGNVDRDAQALRIMAHKRIPMVLAQSFDAAMGLYSDSPSIVSIVANAHADKDRIESQLKHMARAMHSHPPPWGAHVAATILGTESVYNNWTQEVKAMSDRLKSIREKLFDHLTNKLRTPGNWSHIRKTHGMYCNTLLAPQQLQTLSYREHIHLLPEGCFSLGCLNAAKIEQLARAIDSVVRDSPMEDDDLAAQAAMQIEMALRQGFGPDAGF